MSLAKRLDLNAFIVYCNAPVEILRERIKMRSSKSEDASEATLDVLDMQLKKFEPPCTPERVIELATGNTLDSDALRSLVDAVR